MPGNREAFALPYSSRRENGGEDHISAHFAWAGAPHSRGRERPLAWERAPTRVGESVPTRVGRSTHSRGRERPLAWAGVPTHVGKSAHRAGGRYAVPFLSPSAGERNGTQRESAPEGGIPLDTLEKDRSLRSLCLGAAALKRNNDALTPWRVCAVGRVTGLDEGRRTRDVGRGTVDVGRRTRDGGRFHKFFCATLHSYGSNFP